MGRVDGARREQDIGAGPHLVERAALPIGQAGDPPVIEIEPENQGRGLDAQIGSMADAMQEAGRGAVAAAVPDPPDPLKAPEA